jgi:hypothetical protein
MLAITGAQMYRPAALRPVAFDRSQSIEAVSGAPAGVTHLLGRACMNCHSYRTEVPWYGKIAPMSWMVATDVEKGRAAVNFSEWGTRYQKPEVAAGVLAAACADVQQGRMPLPKYVMLHPEARLTDSEKREFCGWTTAEATRLLMLRRQRLAERASR